MEKNDYLDFDIRQKEKQRDNLILLNKENQRKIKSYNKQLKKLYFKKEGEKDEKKHNSI